MSQIEKPTRKEVYLNTDIISKLQAKADKEGRSLKNYMEQVLIKQAEKK